MLVGRLVLVEFNFLVFENSKIVRVNGWNILGRFVDSVCILKLSSHYADSNGIIMDSVGRLDREE